LLATAIVRCPHCANHRTRRSRRRIFERLLSLVGVWPFRCEDCAARFFAFRRGAHVTRTSTL